MNNTINYRSYLIFSDQLVSRGLKRKPLVLIRKLRKAKKEAPLLEKLAVVKTHLRNMIVVPEKVGSIIGIYNGKTNQVSLNLKTFCLCKAAIDNMMISDDETDWVLHLLRILFPTYFPMDLVFDDIH